MTKQVFAGGKAVDLAQVLDNRDWRSQSQNFLEQSFPNAVVVAVKLNIPGEVKNSPAIQQIFRAGWQVLQADLKDFPLQKVWLGIERMTGPEGFLVVDGDLTAVKRVTMAFEQDYALGRLFDSDVMAATADSYQLSREDLGFAPRQCLVCDQPAKYCAKAGRHDFADLHEAIEAMYLDYFVVDPVIPVWNEDQTVRAALAACLYEVTATPKPGLVDPVSLGAHHDMTAFTFIDSSLALEPYFRTVYQHGRAFAGTDLTALLAEIRPVGIQAEQEMFVATDGVNTHKGAIFTLGILIAAYAYATRGDQTTTLSAVQEIVRQIGADMVAKDLAEQVAAQQETAGESQYRRYQLTGVRGEVQDGLLALSQVGLPTLRQSQGTVNQRLLDTLMALAGAIEDSTLIKRAGDPAIVEQMRQWTLDYQKLGGATTPEGMAFLEDLDQQFIDQHLSIGGAADYLILTVFIGRLTGLL